MAGADSASGADKPVGGPDVKVYLLRCNGALIDVFSNEDKAAAHMRQHRKNGEYWRIEVRAVL